MSEKENVRKPVKCVKKGVKKNREGKNDDGEKERQSERGICESLFNCGLQEVG